MQLLNSSVNWIGYCCCTAWVGGCPVFSLLFKHVGISWNVMQMMLVLNLRFNFSCFCVSRRGRKMSIEKTVAVA